MKKILVVSVNWLGDAIFSTPVYKALKKVYPGVHLTALAVPRVRDVLSLCPFIDDIIVFDEDGQHRPLLEKISFAGRLASGKFDAVFFLRPSISRSFICFLAGIPIRVGFRTKAFFGLLTHPVDDNGLETMHRLDAYAVLLERYGIPVADRRAALSVAPAILDRIVPFLQGHGMTPEDTFCIVNTGGNWDLKQWPEDRFIDLSRQIVTTLRWKVLLPGSLKDMERVSRIAAAAGPGVIAMAGGTDIPLLAGIFSRAHALVSADSGPLHLASALGVATVGIFGPTRPEITGPRGGGKTAVLFNGIGCNKAPCYYLECPDNRCMKMIEVKDVVQALQAL